MKKMLSALFPRLNLGSATFDGADWGDLNISHVHLASGVDATPLLVGLPGDLCQCPHWGYVVRGSIHVRYDDGHDEVVRAGEVYHWQAGHTVWTDEDYEAIEFSPADEMEVLMSHLEQKAKGASATDEPRPAP